MHDFDRANISAYGRSDQMTEFEENNEYELDFSPASTRAAAPSSGFSEALEMEMATELLGISSEAELEQFLGGLFKKVVSAGKNAIKNAQRFVNSPTGQGLIALGKRAIQTALPIAAKAAGPALAPYMGPAGPIAADVSASLASSALGMELEGLSPEDQEFEVAKQLVRFLGDAAQKAAAIASDADPAGAARTAMIEAAKIHAPGLLRPVNGRPNAPAARNGGNRPAAVNRQGTWHYENGRIVLNGLLPN